MKRTMLGFVILSCALSLGCETPEEKARNLIERSLKDCKKMEGEFVTIKLNVGEDRILKSTCDNPITSLKMKEGDMADVMVGPYLWSAGLHEVSGVWVVANIEWEDLDKAIRMTKDDAKIESRTKGIPMWESVQKTLPTSPWIREQRFDNVLALRKKTRGKSKNPTELGPAKAVFDELVNWAKKDHPDLAAQTQLKVVNYFKDQGDKLEMALEGIGSQDGHFEASIRQAEKDGDKKTIEKYTKKLEESRAGRDAEIALVNQRISIVRKHACDISKQISPSSVTNPDLKKTLASSLSGICN